MKDDYGSEYLATNYEFLAIGCCLISNMYNFSTDTQDCGTNPQTAEMTGDDAKVLCGEWDTNTSTEEEYNVVLKIKKIIRHPDYDISYLPGLGQLQ